MNTEDENLYDIFEGEPSEPLWLVAVSGLSDAIAVMHRIAVKKPGHYFVLDEKNARLVAGGLRMARLKEEKQVGHDAPFWSLTAGSAFRETIESASFPRRRSCAMGRRTCRGFSGEGI